MTTDTNVIAKAASRYNDIIACLSAADHFAKKQVSGVDLEQQQQAWEIRARHLKEATKFLDQLGSIKPYHGTSPMQSKLELSMLSSMFCTASATLSMYLEGVKHIDPQFEAFPKDLISEGGQS